MSQVPAVIIAGPGTNRDGDVRAALELAGANAKVVLASELVERPRLLGDYRLAVVAGGFSHADSLGAGRMLALDLMTGLGEELRGFVDQGRPLIGICNGFQVLTRTKLLPGALGHNAQGGSIVAGSSWRLRSRASRCGPLASRIQSTVRLRTVRGAMSTPTPNH